MRGKVLVLFATKYGATAEIAEKIAEVLQAGGAQTDVMDVKRVKSIAEYSVVVLGSASYIGSWRREMTRFVEKNVVELSQKMIWVFTSGPTGTGDPQELMKGILYPPKLKAAMDTIKPADITVFHGAINPGKLSGLEKWIIGKVGASIGDYRNWDMITAWAKSILAKL
mgnify:CR=1 FL=1